MVDFALFMERYGYRILLGFMIAFTFGFIAGIVAFWSYFTNGFAAPILGMYGLAVGVVWKAYVFLFGEDPKLYEDSTEKYRERGRQFFKTFRW